MEIMLNGERKQVQDGLTVAKLLEQFSIQPERVVVEVNLTVLKREQVSTTVLKEGDQVEIVHFVGGGSKNGTWGMGRGTCPMSPVPCPRQSGQSNV